MKALSYVLLLLVLFVSNMQSTAQECSCTKYPEYSELISCDTTVFDNNALIFWNYNCDSSWLTFITPQKHKVDLFNMGDMISLTGRLGFVGWQEYKTVFVMQYNVISSCCTPPDYYVFDKTKGVKLDSLGNLLYVVPDKDVPIVVSIDGDAIKVLNIETKKSKIIDLGKGTIAEMLKANNEMYPEYLFNPTELKDDKVILHCNAKGVSEKNKKIEIDLNDYK